MKKIGLFVLALQMCACLVMAAGGQVYPITLFSAQSATDTNFTSSAIDLNVYKPHGYFSYQMTLTGTGTVKVEYQVSNNGTDYMEPASASDVVAAGFGASSGPGSDGKTIVSFQPVIARHMKIKVTATGTAVVSGWLVLQ